MTRPWLKTLLFLPLFQAFSFIVYGQALPDPGERDGVILWLSGNEAARNVQLAWQEKTGSSSSPLEHLGFDLYRMSVDTAHIAWLRALEDVRYAGPNRRASLRNGRPNDPEYGQQWHHELLGSERVWAISTGGWTEDGHRISVAVMDAGFERTHEDIQPSLWINPLEVPDDGIDNDNNGYIDDYDGYNPRANDGNLPVHPHGQSVAGYMGAKGNNGLGVAGLSWDAELMLLAPTLREDDVIRGFRFLYDWRRRFNDSRGAEGAYIPVVNMSFGFDAVFPKDLPWMCPLVDSLGSVGMLVVAASPNEALDIGVVGDMPCTCPSSNLLCITNTTRDDALVSNAAISKSFVHLAAPGFQSFTTRIGQYGLFSGTSAAAPMVAGVIGLLAALPCDSTRQMIFEDPRRAADYLRQAVLDGVVPLRDLKDVTITGGRLSLWSDKGIGAVPALANLCGSAEGPVAVLGLLPNPANDQVRIRMRTPGTAPQPVRIFNVLGQLIWESRFEPVNFEPKELDVNVTHWPAGMYMVVLGSGKAVASAKLLIHH